MTEQIEEILQFWFGELRQGFPVTNRKSLWWFGDEAVDRQLEELFGHQVRQALWGQLDDWAGQPRGRLALIILLDQFTRSIYRGSADAFSGEWLHAIATDRLNEISQRRSITKRFARLFGPLFDAVDG